MNCNRLWSASTTYRGRFVADQAHHVHHLWWTKVHERVLAISVERPVIVFWPTSISQLSDLDRGSRIHTRSWLSRSPFYSFSSFYFLFFPRISRHRRLTHLRNNQTRLLWRASTRPTVGHWNDRNNTCMPLANLILLTSKEAVSTIYLCVSFTSSYEPCLIRSFISCLFYIFLFLFSFCYSFL